VTEMSASELRELRACCFAKGSADNLPTLPEYLPKKDAVANSAKYILGRKPSGGEVAAHRRAD